MKKPNGTKKRKDCSFTYCVWFRKNDPEGPPFSIEINCTTHEAKWFGFTSSLEMCEHIIDGFPLTVCGGIASGKDCFPIPDECLLGKIPRKPVIANE